MNTIARPLLSSALLLAVVLAACSADPAVPDAGASVGSRIFDLVLLQANPTATPAGSSTPAPRTATIGEIVNIVEARAATTANFAPAALGLVLGVGGQARTGANSRARLDFDEGSIVRLGANSSLTVQALSGSDPNLLRRFLLDVGKIWVSLFGGTIEVETPVGVATVRGSFGVVQYDRQADILTFDCIEGDCAFTNTGGTTAMGNLQGMTLGNRGTQRTRRTLSAADVQDFVANNPEAAGVSATLTAAPTGSPTALPSATNTPTTAPTPSPAGSLTPTATVPTPIPTATPTPVATSTPTTPPTATDTPLPTRPPTNTRAPRVPTDTPTPGPSDTPLPLLTATPTRTRLPTRTPTPTTSITPLPQVWCVDTTGGPTGAPCANPLAFTRIQAAVNIAHVGEEIRIAAGTYFDTGTSVVTLVQQQMLTGGFPGGTTGWTTPGTPDLTIIQAASAQNAIELQGAIDVAIQNLTLKDGGVLNNAGTATVHVRFAELHLDNSGFSNGHFDTALNSGIIFGPGNHVLVENPVGAGGVTFTGPGYAGLHTGTLTLNGNVTAQNFDLKGSILNGAGDLAVNGQFRWEGGTLGGTGTLQLLTTANLSIAGAANKYLDTRAIKSMGYVSWADTGDIYVSNGATFNNHGAFDAMNDQNWFYSGGVMPAFHNWGNFTKATGPNRSTFGIIFDNHGSVFVQVGALDFFAGGTSAGRFDLAPNTALNFKNGNYNLAAGNDISGGGVARVDGGTLTLTANTTLRNLELTAGAITGAGTLDTTGMFRWLGGTMSGPGVTNIAPAAALEIAGASNKFLDSRRLNNGGNAVWRDTGDIYISGGATFENNGTFDVQNDQSILATATTASPLLNAGSFNKNLGAGVTTISSGFTNSGNLVASSGTLNFTGGYLQNAGSTTLNGGNISAPGTFDIASGILAGNGAINANVSNAGLLKPGMSTGLLTINGGYTQMSTGALEIEIGNLAPAPLFDQLQVSGSAALSGTLNLVLTNSYSPNIGDNFPIMTYYSYSGAFATINGQIIPPGDKAFDPIYSSVGLSLGVKPYPQPPAPYPTWNIPEGLAPASACTTTPPAPKLTAPAPASRVTTARVQLSWSSVNCATRYQIVVKQDSTTGATIARDDNLTQTRYVTKPLAQGKTYFWRVQACNQHGCRAAPWQKFTVNIPNR